LNKAKENIEEQVNNSLDKIRNYLHKDGGDIEFVSWEAENGILNLRFLGNCADCSFSIMTLRGGIERFLKIEIPEIKRVEEIKIKK
jgi:Fe-S cluster biogenesis protein NfuA